MRALPLLERASGASTAASSWGSYTWASEGRRSSPQTFSCPGDHIPRLGGRWLLFDGGGDGDSDSGGGGGGGGGGGDDAEQCDALCDEPVMLKLRPSSMVALLPASGAVGAFFMPVVGAIIDFSPKRRQFGIAMTWFMLFITAFQGFIFESTWEIVMFSSPFLRRPTSRCRRRSWRTCRRSAPTTGR